MVAENKFIELHLIKYGLFKSQNIEDGRFDITFEVEGKLIYAHKNMLNLVSDTFDSMLSDRWTQNKDEPIKIKDYNYNDFYQFLTFLYSGQCELNDANNFTMVDVAEFYGVQLFKDYCDEYLSTIEITTDNIFVFLDLADKYSLVHFKATVHGYIANNFQAIVGSDEFLKVSKQVLKDLVADVKEKVKPEDLFEATYKWCEIQATDKQAEEPNVNLSNTIKMEISDFLPYIPFNRMELLFMTEFIVPRSFIFSSLDELSQVLSARILLSTVTITNSLGQTLSGDLIPNKTVIENIKSLKSSSCFRGYDTYCWWNTTFTVPSSPSPLKKKKGVEWYLIFHCNGELGIRISEHIHESHYLLAELSAGESGFDTASDCKIEITE